MNARDITAQGSRVVGAVLLLGVLAGCAGSGERTAVEVFQTAALDHDRVTADPGMVRADTTPGEGGLAEYLEIGLSRNRSLRSALAEWQAALERVPQVKALPDPTLSYGVFLREVETRVGPQKQRLGVSQSIPWFGTLGLRGEAALAATEAAHQRYRNQRLQVMREITTAYAEYRYLAAALEITRDNADLLGGWERILRSRLATSQVGYDIVIKAQVELARLEDRIITLEDQRHPHMARLIALLDLPGDTVLPWPGSDVVGWAPDSEEEIRGRLAEANPELLSLRAVIDAETRNVSLAGKAGYPDFTLGFDWTQTDRRDVPDLVDNGKDPLMARIAIRVPLWRNKVGAGSREARARRTSAEERLASRENELGNELSLLHFRYRDADRKMRLYRDTLLPKGDQSMRAAYSAFESGDAGFLDVLDAERTLLEFSLSLERARADLVTALAGLAAISGREMGTRLEETNR